MHVKYISSDESYQEYLDHLNNEILLHFRDKKKLKKQIMK